MLKTTAKIPEVYIGEFVREQTEFIKNRVHLLCILTVVIYFFSALLLFIINPYGSEGLEIMGGLFLIAAGGLILYFNSRVRTLHVAKMNAYLFTALLLMLLVKMGGAYAGEALISSSMLIFTLFLVSITIPWTPPEVSVIGLMHVGAYTADFFYARIMASSHDRIFGAQQYLDGFVFLLMAFLLCVVIRMKETARDVENFVLFKEVEGNNRKMNNELALATRIHKTLLPGPLKDGRLDIALNYMPVRFMGGDYANYIRLGDGRLVFIISDVTGHGVSSALLVNRVHAEFERLAKAGREPGALMKELNGFICEDFEGTDMFLSAFCGLLDLKDGKLSYSNYGHPPQFLCRSEISTVELLPAQATLLGLPIFTENLYQSETPVEKGDRILLFTDGLTEATNAAKEQFGGARVRDFLRDNCRLPSETFNRELLREANRFKDGDFEDDVFIFTIGIDK